MTIKLSNKIAKMVIHVIGERHHYTIYMMTIILTFDKKKLTNK